MLSVQFISAYLANISHFALFFASLDILFVCIKFNYLFPFYLFIYLIFVYLIDFIQPFNQVDRFKNFLEHISLNL